LALTDDRVLIVAEVGSNHNGDLGTALRLIDTAAECGADIVKFQAFRADTLLAADEPDDERLRRLEVPREWYASLMGRCSDRGVRFLSTATDFTTLAWMEEAGAWAYKVASCNITYRPMLERLIAIGKPVIVSTGMATVEEILETARLFDAGGLDDYTFLHCVARYPTPASEMNLGNIPELKRLLGRPVGLSDHSTSVHLASAAVALGARIIEKHFSLDKSGVGMDHEVAVLPEDFVEMCRGIRETEAALAVGFEPDRETMYTMRRSLHFARPMTAGECLGADDLLVTRPEDGLPPADLPLVIGRKLAADVVARQPVAWPLLNEAE